MEDIDFSEFEDCSRVSVSFVCFVFSRSLSHGLSLFLGLDIHFIWSVLYPMVVVKSVSGELRGLDSRRFICLHSSGGEAFFRLECCGLGDVFA